MNKVTEYIDKQKSSQKDILKKLRKIILKTFPKIKEDIKMGVPWYEGKYYLVGLKDSVNLGFSVKGLKKKEADLFKGSGKFMRHLKFRDINEINQKEIVRMLKLVKECGSCFK